MTANVSLTEAFHSGDAALAQLQQHSDRLIIAKFVAPHCSACVTLKPVLTQLVADHADKVYLVEIDMTEAPDLAIDLGIRSAPTVVFLRRQQVLARLSGLKAKKEYLQILEKNL